MGSMHTGLEEMPNGHVNMAEFYATRAKGGVALMVTGGIGPNQEGGVHIKTKMLDSDEAVAHHKMVTDADAYRCFGSTDVYGYRWLPMFVVHRCLCGKNADA